MRRDFPSNFMVNIPALFVPGSARSEGSWAVSVQGSPKGAKPLNFKGLCPASGFAKKPFYGYNISYFEEGCPQASEEYR
jgi:hypothetical protein